jgi:hypothetical protein
MFFTSDIYTRSSLIVLSLVTLGARPAVAQVGLGLAPLRIEARARPGETYSDTLTISNESDRATRVRASMLDFWIDDNQEPQFRSFAESQSATSCRSWVRSNPSEFELGPKQQRLVRFTIAYPVDMQDGSFNCALAFTGLSPVGGTGNGVVTNVRLVTAMYILKGDSVPNGIVRKVEVHVNGSNREAAISMENVGKVYFRPTGKVDLLTADGRVIESVPLRPIPVLPGRLQRLLVPLSSRYQPGQKIRARFEIGNGEIQEIFANAEGSSEAK